jgi:hypothetical protein
VRLALPLLAALTIGVGACDEDSAGDSEQFCAEVAENVEALRAAPATDDEVDGLIDLWRRLGDDAPLAIESEWTRLVDNLELAWTSDDEQEILAGTFASERSAVDVATWIADNCGFDFGPVTTIVPGTVATTTLPGATTTSTSSTTTSP